MSYKINSDFRPLRILWPNILVFKKIKDWLAVNLDFNFTERT